MGDRWPPSGERKEVGSPVYVCLCNALTDTDIKQAIADGACRPRDAYSACGCRAECGGCTKAILCLIRDAQAAARTAAYAGRAAAA